jgi:dTDP-4-amino-4,6-dideoxygalactose transaminase
MFDNVNKFESVVAEFYGSKYAVATDCCTHALELCLRLVNPKSTSCPKHTYLSVPMTLEKLNINWKFNNQSWKEYYYLENTPIIDAAVLWRNNSYIPGTLMCLSFQYRKHLNLGRGGMILLDDESVYNKLIKFSYDGRDRNIPWAKQQIDSLGYHYYMTPETAKLGLTKFKIAVKTLSKEWSYLDYPDLSILPVFQKILSNKG